MSFECFGTILALNLKFDFKRAKITPLRRVTLQCARRQKGDNGF